MCGISGFVGASCGQAARAVRAMNDAMAHRGPDGDGQCVEPFGGGWIGLGHRRLSIIDLSSAANQPMWTPDRSAALIFNGEIFNFLSLRQSLSRSGWSFTTTSDTEVLLSGLTVEGPDFIQKLEGMYAFAYFNRNKQSLLLARDPVGIKPLYYYHDAERFLFASEVRPILATGAVKTTLSRDAVASFLAYGSVAQPLSIVESVEMLEPGTTMELIAGAPAYEIQNQKQWWRLPEPAFGGTAEEAAAHADSLLSAAVRDHLIADVPVGVFLSAGIDSTLLASLAHEHSGKVRAFTVALSQDRDLDEMRIARDTAQRIGIEHVPVVMTESRAEEAAFEWLASADQPSIDGLNTFIISRAVREHGVKVAISGLGADELFGGYPSFREVPKLVQLATCLRVLPRQLRSLIAKGVAFRKSACATEKLTDMLESRPSISTYSLLRRRLLSNRQMSLLGFQQGVEDTEGLWLPTPALGRIPTTDMQPGWTISKIELDFYQRNTLLRDSDANSMANSLEIRVPFLDQRLLNWVPTLPDAIRFSTAGAGKKLLRQAGRRHLDNVHLRRPKTGFVLPLHRWMKGPLAKLCLHSLESLKASGIVEPSGVDAIWSEFSRDGGTRSSSRALALVALGASLRYQTPKVCGGAYFASQESSVLYP